MSRNIGASVDAGIDFSVGGKKSGSPTTGNVGGDVKFTNHKEQSASGDAVYVDFHNVF
eukprot:Pgem_evm1s16455